MFGGYLFYGGSLPRSKTQFVGVDPFYLPNEVVLGIELRLSDFPARTFTH